MYISDSIATFGRYLQLMWRVLALPERWRMFGREYVKEMASLGVDSLGIVVLISFFIGAVICIQINTPRAKSCCWSSPPPSCV